MSERERVVDALATTVRAGLLTRRFFGRGKFPKAEDDALDALRDLAVLAHEAAGIRENFARLDSRFYSLLEERNGLLGRIERLHKLVLDAYFDPERADEDAEAFLKRLEGIEG